MKFVLAPRRAEQGTSYLTVLWIASCAGIVLAGYLSMVSNQNMSSMRSQAWNRCIAVSEAGVEEAIAHLNKNGTTNMNFVVDGWYNWGGVYFKRGHVDEGTYDVEISKDRNPVILSRGSLPLMQNFACMSDGSGPFLADLGWVPVSSDRMQRTVKAITMPQGAFCRGIIAKYWVKLSGGAMVDSFDSSDPTGSTNGLYCTALRRDHGGVACNAGLTNYNDIVGTGTMKVYGPIATGPKGTYGLVGNASVGDIAWVDASTPGVKDGWFRDDMNMQFPVVQEPFTGGYFTPGEGTVNGTNYAYVLGSDKYKLSKLKMVSSDTMMVTGNAILWVAGDIDMTANSAICILPNASLKLYVGTATGSGTGAKLAGQGIVNVSGFSTNLMYYGLPSNTSVDYSGGSSFAGAIYAPSADLKLAGGGSTDPNFAGAAVAATVTIVGTYHFAYDEALASIMGKKIYVLCSWDEL